MSPITPGPPPPKRQRLRIPRSCNPCRSKKVKCDGEHPCSSCKKHPENCTYVQDSRPNNENGSEDRKAMESRLHRLESLLVRMIGRDERPSGSATPNAAPTMQPTMATTKPSGATVPSGNDGSLGLVINTGTEDLFPDKPSITFIDKVLEAAEADDQGNWSYQGSTSGQSFLRQLRSQFGIHVNDDPGRDMGDYALHIRRAIDDAMHSGWRGAIALPPKAVAEELAIQAITDACGVMISVHRPTFLEMLRRMYEKPFDAYDKDENAFLPLAYTVLSVGYIYKDDTLGTPAKERALQDGTRFFIAARQNLDFLNARTLPALQTLIFMTLFTAHTGQMTMAYSLISMALTSALQMGLHRKLPSEDDYITAECKKRSFWVIRKLEFSIGTLLGLPQSLDEKSINQDLPTPIDDAYITKARISKMPEGSISIAAAINAHTRLYRIAPKIAQLVNGSSVGDIEAGQNTRTYVVSKQAMSDIERELQSWLEGLPQELRPGYRKVVPQLERIRYYLRVSYSFIQLALYRPFLKYIRLTNVPQSKLRRCSASAAACVSVSRNIIQVTHMMFDQGLLKGEMWFATNTAFLAIMTLAVFVRENVGDPRTKDIFAEARGGQEVLAALARHSLWADRCTKSLKLVFEKLLAQVSASDSSAQTSVGLPTPNHTSTQQGSGTLPAIDEILNPSYPQQDRAFQFSANPTPAGASAALDSTEPSSQWSPGTIQQSTPQSFGDLLPPLPAGPPLNSGHNNPPSEIDSLLLPPDEPLAYPGQAFSMFGMQDPLAPGTTTHTPSTGSNEDMVTLYHDASMQDLFADYTNAILPDGMDGFPSKAPATFPPALWPGDHPNTAEPSFE